ncbi:glycosyltransferase [Candidatus Uhrbacteria bacterium]|jgi:glycosyltransferase involved in cell wall biosynthesis|nr:glycosyltransferase [Candidatus Uhrbacteria bacterium]
MKIALVHDYLIQNGGAEKVLGVFQGLWPKAPTFTLFFDPKKLPHFAGRDIRTSFLERLPLGRRKYQWYLPLMPTATEHYDLSDYDVVISSTSAFAKGIITREDALHICYCHTPTRYLWSDTHSYIEELRVPGFIKKLLPPVLSRLRLWDRQAADRVDVFVANSKTVQRRIQKYYRADSHVIYPPVDTHRFNLSNKPKEYFLTGGRLVAYKRYDMVIEAANKTGIPLKVFGSGPVEKDLRKMAKGNIEFLGRVSDKEQAELYANAKAFIHPQIEDFGITPVESMSAGRPVIAYRKGGATETVKEGLSGEFFDEQSWEELADHMIRFDDAAYDPHQIQKHAELFSRERFEREMTEFVNKQIQNRNEDSC